MSPNTQFSFVLYFFHFNCTNTRALFSKQGQMQFECLALKEGPQIFSKYPPDFVGRQMQNGSWNISISTISTVFMSIQLFVL